MRNAAPMPTGNPFVGLSACASSDRYRNIAPGSRPAQSLAFFLAAVTLATGISACSVTKTMKLDTAQMETVTGSISAPMKAQGIDDTDAELIKSAVAGTGNGEPESNVLAWSNPDTGNRGTITAVNEFVSDGGQNCRKFRTTVDSFVGISQYSGEACEMTKGSWVLSSLYRN
jgi:surface antigen